MRKSITRALAGALLAGAALLALSGASWSMCQGGGMNFDPGRMLDHMDERLDLSDDQRSQIEELLNATREKNRTDREQLATLREKLHALREDFDSDRARAIATQIGEITGNMVFEMSRTHAQVFALLDAEQRAEMDELMERRHRRGGKWRKD
ncbi:MAG: Spy/CpxP family protein refolding chaperone [Halioglobus sp.]|nr:Spy/CpxP family protein refolding chaperone [Halioglobus sp.]